MLTKRNLRRIEPGIYYNVASTRFEVRVFADKKRHLLLKTNIPTLAEARRLRDDAVKRRDAQKPAKPKAKVPHWACRCRLVSGQVVIRTYATPTLARAAQAARNRADVQTVLEITPAPPA